MQPGLLVLGLECFVRLRQAGDADRPIAPALIKSTGELASVLDLENEFFAGFFRRRNDIAGLEM